MVKKINEPDLIKKTIDSYIVLDIETTGLNPQKDGITEIAMIKVKHHHIVEEYARLIHPRRRIPIEITMLTGISNAMVRNEPYMEEILNEIRTFIGDSIIMGHKVSMDLEFLKQYDPTFFDRKYMDTLRYARKAFPYLQSCALTSLTEEFDLPANTHRALDDVYATKALYDLILEKRGSIERVYSFNSLIDGINEQQLSTLQINSYFEGKHCVVSGYFSEYSKKTIAAYLKKCNAYVAETVDRSTQIYILGEHPKALTKKYRQVLRRIEEGQQIQIIEEKQFYSYIQKEHID